MNAQTYKQLKDINDQLLSIANMNIILDYSELKNIWDLAIRYNKAQNEALRDGFPDDVICQKDLFDEVLNDCKIVSFYARLKWSRLQWAKMLIANAMFLTRQQIKGVMRK